nr:LPXTG cell wall anchor domain-containing protein [uncultured Mediterraneibacter sp.]
MKNLKKLILSACFCLLIASVIPVQAQAASVGSDSTVTYTKGKSNMDDGTDNMTSLQTKPVKTGDNTSITGYALIAVGSAAFLLLILFIKKKKSEEEESIS